MSRFHDTLNPKEGFFNPICPSVVVVVVCGNGKIQKNDQI